MLAVLGALGTYYENHLAATNAYPEGPGRFVILVPTLMTAVGLIAVYHGMALLLLGEVLAKSDWQTMSVPGFL